MQGIEFEKENYGRPMISQGPKRSWLIGLVMKIGGRHVKDEEQAKKILLIIAIIFFVLSLYNFFFK